MQSLSIFKANKKNQHQWKAHQKYQNFCFVWHLLLKQLNLVCLYFDMDEKPQMQHRPEARCISLEFSLEAQTRDLIGEGVKQIRLFLGHSPKLLLGGGQES